MNTITSIKTALKRITAVVASAFQFRQKRALGPGSTPNINALLLNLCEGDRDRALWVLRWLAYPLRNEGAKMATALLVSGSQGAGKSLFFEQIIGPMFGNRLAMPRNFGTSTFTDWMSRKSFVLINDFRNDATSAAYLKFLLTSAEVTIDQKGLARRIERNKMNFVFMSSDARALKPDVGDRRFMVIEPAKPLPPAVYAAVAGEIANGGIEDFHYFLTQQLDMDGFSTRAVPANKTIALKVAA